MSEYGQWWPLTAEQVADFQALGRNAVWAEVEEAVKDTYPTARNIRVVLHAWDESDSAGNALAREHYGYPEWTMGTVGWKADMDSTQKAISDKP